MKKIYNPTDVQQKEGHELSKKLYRTISEHAKRIDDARGCVRNIADLFTPLLLAQRRKFCEYCERLIFSEPALYGRKGEELLWRKGFYEVVSTAKKLKKKEFSEQEILKIQAHISSGVGFYHHLLSKLQWQFKIELKNVMDCDIIIEDKNECADVTPEVLEWARQSVHQCLVYLGDLCRYQLELKQNSEPTLAVRYYLQAISYKSTHGMPHNQMGTLAMNRNNFLDAVYHYLCCLTCEVPFDGTTNNLQNLFEKNSKFIETMPATDNENAECIIEPGKAENIKYFIARFLLLIDIWYFNKKVPKVYSLCHQTFKNLEECLTYPKPSSSESGDTPSSELESRDNDAYLNSQMLFKVVVICLLTIYKLQSTNSQQLSTLVAFTLGIYSQIIQNITTHIQEAVLNYPLPEDRKKSRGILKELMTGGKKKSSTKLRRRKAVKLDSDEESDLSDHNEEADYSSSDDSFISDTEDILVESSDEEIDIIKVSNESIVEKSKEIPSTIITNGTTVPNNIVDPTKQKDNVLKKVQKMNVGDMIEIITEEGSLQSIKIMNDWLKSDLDIVKSCGTNTRTLIKQMVYLVNLVNVNASNMRAMKLNVKISDVIKKEDKIPLSEDAVLKGLRSFKNVQKDLQWTHLFKRSLSAKQEAIIRIIKILSFGKLLSKIGETGVTFDEDKNIFVCQCANNQEDEGISAAAIMEELERQELNGSPTKTVLTNGEIKPPPNGTNINKMKHMGELWLAAEVRDLETRFGGGKSNLSPYLVLDADVLIKYTNMVKQLVHSRKFIVLIPAIVVSALDDLKKEKIEARDAIRWLESQFHRGNRFFRAQRPQEKTPIPFIKYPKKKDKDMHIYIQIIECCHFFAEQQKGASNVVTLLIGNNSILTNGDNKDFSYIGLAQSVGIAVEPITSFYGKWKKSKGNR